jgi:hypothetical protein
MNKPHEKPTREKVYLAQLQRDVTMNFITLRDDEWMLDKFGREKLQTAFAGETLDLDCILALFFRVLVKEDKENILKVKIFDDSEMELKEVVFDDPVKKLRAIISGQKEITDIIVALTQTRIKSNPYVVEMLKKKVADPNQSAADSDGIKPRI